MKQRFEIAHKSLATLCEILSLEKSVLVRDASIQRFQYTVEAVWKAAKGYLLEMHAVDLASPKSVIRACFQAGVLSEQQGRRAMKMVEDRNLTVHTYNEALAEEIYSRLPPYAELMQQWLDAMESRIPPPDGLF